MTETLLFPYMRDMWLFFAYLKGLRQWYLSLYWWSRSLWGISFLLFVSLAVCSRLKLFSFCGLLSLYMSWWCFTVDDFFVRCFSQCTSTHLSALLLTMAWVNLLSAIESGDSKTTKYSRALRRGRSKVCLHEGSDVCTYISTFWWMRATYWT